MYLHQQSFHYCLLQIAQPAGNFLYKGIIGVAVAVLKKDKQLFRVAIHKKSF